MSEEDLTKKALEGLGLKTTDRHNLPVNPNLENTGLEGISEEDKKLREKQIAEQCEQDELYQDGYEGFEDNREPGKAGDDNKGSSLGGAREQLKANLAGNFAGVEDKDLPPLTDRLDQFRAAVGYPSGMIVEAETFLKFSKQFELTESEALESVKGRYETSEQIIYFDESSDAPSGIST